MSATNLDMATVFPLRVALASLRLEAAVSLIDGVCNSLTDGDDRRELLRVAMHLIKEIVRHLNEPYHSL